MARSHGESRTRLYGVWLAMRRRCDLPSTTFYKDYGGRGITVCPEWQDWGTFRDWAKSSGYELGLTIERIDNDGNYEPSNCTWATRSEQALNRRSTHQVSAFGETKSVSEWAEDSRCSVKYATLYKRLILKRWDAERAITQEVK